MKKPILTVLALAALSGGALALYRFTPTGGVPTPAAVAARPEGSPLVTVKTTALQGDAALGEIAFNAKCAACHGKNAAGQAGVAPPLVHKIYEPNHHGDQAFLLAAQNGVRAHHWPFGDMAPVKGLSRADVQAIVAYVRTLQRANGIF